MMKTKCKKNVYHLKQQMEKVTSIDKKIYNETKNPIYFVRYD